MSLPGWSVGVKVCDPSELSCPLLGDEQCRGGVGAAHAGRGGVQRNLAFVVRLSLCPESGSIEEGEGKPTSSCIQDEPQLHSSSFPLLWEEARLSFGLCP